MRYHGRLGLVETPDISKGLLTARRLLRLNGERRHPCPHVAIDSDCRGTGKRTCCTTSAWAFRADWRSCTASTTPHPRGLPQHPPAPGTPADWSAVMATFLGWDLYRHNAKVSLSRV
ncbi:hypothetical protein ELQ87_00015 [Streptomyces griseoviridis]|uniref:Uncharacterized protein n=1 Tax=Streptomyces griseoviridis TaxID=45398 RepID=A0A3S9Z527_STRGD|nr:hypothetical protein [Streptomyces griseoviridis]AZS82864.1 hypothetical protein ELQ87_00015 [Streptomyces griseoviridis]